MRISGFIRSLPLVLRHLPNRYNIQHCEQDPAQKWHAAKTAVIDGRFPIDQSVAISIVIRNETYMTASSLLPDRVDLQSRGSYSHRWLWQSQWADLKSNVWCVPEGGNIFVYLVGFSIRMWLSWLYLLSGLPTLLCRPRRTVLRRLYSNDASSYQLWRNRFLVCEQQFCRFYLKQMK